MPDMTPIDELTKSKYIIEGVVFRTSLEMRLDMQRREFLAGLGSFSLAYSSCPTGAVARVQRRIGFLVGQPKSDSSAIKRVDAFRQSLNALGLVEGQNLTSTYRWRNDSSDADLNAQELIQTRPEVLMCNGTSALAALQRATTSIPIVFAQVSDPVGGGFVRNLSQPGGNITGFTDYEYSFSAKWLELLVEIAPRVAGVAIIYDPNIKILHKFIPSIEARANEFQIDCFRIAVTRRDELIAKLRAFGKGKNRGMIVLAGRRNLGMRETIITMAKQYKVPAIYPYRTYALDGGLISYGVNTLEMYRGAAAYVARILQGTKIHNLPVQFSKQFEFVLNVKAAHDIGVPVPPKLALRATEVIE